MDHSQSGVPLPPLDTPNVRQVQAAPVRQVLLSHARLVTG